MEYTLMIIMISSREHLFTFDTEKELNKIYKKTIDALHNEEDYLHIAQVEIRLDYVESVALFKDGEMLPPVDDNIGYG